MLDQVYQNCLKFEKSCDTFLSQREFPFTSKWIFTNRTLYPITENIHANEQSHQGQAKEQAMVVGRVHNTIHWRSLYPVDGTVNWIAFYNWTLLDCLVYLLNHYTHNDRLYNSFIATLQQKYKCYNLFFISPSYHQIHLTSSLFAFYVSSLVSLW